MRTANDLLIEYSELDWDTYIDLCDKLCSVNVNNIEEELRELPLIFSHYAGLASLAKKEVEKARQLLTQFVAKTRVEEQERRQTLGLKTTDKTLETVVNSKPEYAKIEQEINTRLWKYNMLVDLKNSMNMKKDNLVQISVNARAEAKIYS